MADFPYIQNANVIKKFFDHVQKAGVPEKVNSVYIAQVGFKSSNDRAIIGILKTLGFLGPDQAPTPLWQSFRNRTQAGNVMAGAVRKVYANLFSTYPDAHRKDSEALRNYFSAHTKVADSTLTLIVSTFRALCTLADFEGPPIPAESEKSRETPPVRVRHDILPDEPPAGRVPAININIQLQLPATDDSKIYESLFAAMKKHLFP